MIEHRLSPREKQVVALLLQGCENSEIARELRVALRTVKAHLNRLYLKFGIASGIKRVKLATLVYRSQLCEAQISTEAEHSARKKAELLLS